MSDISTHKESDETTTSIDQDASERVTSSNAGKAPHSRRLHTLNIALERHPDNCTIYLARAELFMQRREYHLAKADFEKAADLAHAALPQTSWGLIEQTVLDQAQQGLRRLAYLVAS